MELESIITAVITGGLAFAGTVVSNVVSHSKTIYRIEQLEKKQDKHNSIIERVYAVEKGVDILEERQRATTERLDDLEEKERELEHGR